MVLLVPAPVSSVSASVRGMRGGVMFRVASAMPCGVTGVTGVTTSVAGVATAVLSDDPLRGVPGVVLDVVVEHGRGVVRDVVDLGLLVAVPAVVVLLPAAAVVLGRGLVVAAVGVGRLVVALAVVVGRAAVGVLAVLVGAGVRAAAVVAGGAGVAAAAQVAAVAAAAVAPGGGGLQRADGGQEAGESQLKQYK